MAIYCLNLACPHPQNPDRHRFCQACGQRLQLGDRFQAVQRFNPTPAGQTTWLGWDTQTIIQPRCLIKVVQAQGTTTQQQQADLQRSREFAVRFGSLGAQTQLSTLLAYYERDRNFYTVQSFINGETAEQRLQQQGTFTVPALVDLLHSSLLALDILHRQQLVHRDLNPTNLIQIPGRTDWCITGLEAAKVVPATPQSRLGTRIGSAEYAAPEQVRGQATPASDLYSLGVVALHLLTRLSPFDLIDPLTGQWLWRSVAIEVPDRLAAILDRLVAADLGDRYPAVAPVQADLAEFAPPPPRPTPAVIPRPPATLPMWRDPIQLQTESNPAPPHSTDSTAAIAVQCLAYSPDDRWLLAGRADHTLLAWDLTLATTAAPRCFTGHQGAVTALALLPDGQTAFSGSWDTTLRRWDLQDPARSPQVFQGHHAAVTALAVLPDGHTLVSGSRDRQLIWWQAGTGQVIHTNTEHTATITAIAASPDVPILATADTDGYIHLWSTQSHQRLRTLPRRSGQVAALAWGQQGILISTHWDLQTCWQQADTGGIHHQQAHSGLPLLSLRADPKTSSLVTLGSDRHLNQWQIQPEASGSLTVQTQPLPAAADHSWQAIAISLSGQYLAGGTTTGQVYLWHRAAEA